MMMLKLHNGMVLSFGHIVSDKLGIIIIIVYLTLVFCDFLCMANFDDIKMKICKVILMCTSKTMDVIAESNLDECCDSESLMRLMDYVPLRLPCFHIKGSHSKTKVGFN